MKISKKLTIAGIIVSVVFGATFIYSIIPQRTNIKTVNAVVIYNCSGENINEQLSNEEALIIYNIFNKKVLDQKTTAAKFTSNVSILFGDQVFCVSCNGYPVVKLQNNSRYFTISDADRRVVEGIFEKYGGVFPCV